MIETLNDAYYMELALASAQKAFDQGEFPVGAVIVCDGRVVAQGHRVGTGALTGRPSEIDHAEMRALKELEGLPLGFDPAGAVIFSTMEPCLMCFSAIILSGIKKIVYAYEDPMGGGTCCDLGQLPPLYKTCGIKVFPGVLRKKSLDLFVKFFQKENNLYWKNSLLERYTLSQAGGMVK
ncbi:nucleoside deaminase [Desulforapulum autotrophicum]|nr:nucleoside deaminase [Desulforapulum autotrophicum]